ncbi:MAG: hypothetical protein OES13_07905 [Acidimicrobiia bacterium]|nr:hypothetical protein [Acidimicrobiia bacterium]
MPLVLILAIFAVLGVAVMLWRRGDTGSAGRFIGTTALVWLGLMALAILMLTMGTLIFGR